MNTIQRSRRLPHLRGQALPAAVIVLTVLLVVGLVFLGIVNRNIQQGAASVRRNQSQDLSEAGLKFAHSQLQYSEKRADWRPAAPALVAVSGDTTRDPDLRYLRPASGFQWDAGNAQPDLGGPDGLGPFSRMEFQRGRSLIRVRYGVSEPNLFAANPSGSLRNPGTARNYIIIESIGRPGRINPNDPTTLPTTEAVQFRNFASQADFNAARDRIAQRDAGVLSSRRLIAYAPIGIIDHAMFITAKDDPSRPADLGADPLNGLVYEGLPVVPQLQFGGAFDAPGNQVIQGSGSIWSNADLRFFGEVRTILNQGLGDGIRVAGRTIGGTDDSRLVMIAKNGDESNVTDDRTITLTNAGGDINGTTTSDTLDSGRANFRTVGALLRDGDRRADRDGQPRFIGRMEPPSFTAVDPATGVNTYFTATRDSGRIGARGNSGRFGHGRNVYVNNVADRQIPLDEEGRTDVGGESSLVHDWLNPDNRLQNSGWQGNFYVPVGATLRFVSDGFVITRDGRAPNIQRTWRTLDGADTGSSTLRYRIGGDPDGAGPQPPYLINAITNPGDIESANPAWTNGFPFDGVLFFEGNVRVRGIIPTDIQLTVLSQATIYVEGSIVKGVTDASGNRLTRPSRSALMLMAKDYVAVNTTQFFGLQGGQGLSAIGQDLQMGASGGVLGLYYELPWRSEPVSGLPAVTSSNPSTWRPAALDYVEAGTSNAWFPSMLLTHSMNAASGDALFSASLNVGVGLSGYNFPTDSPSFAPDLLNVNSANRFYTPLPATIPIYGLGLQPWQFNGRFETRSFPLVRDTFSFTGSTLTANSGEGTFQQFVGGIANDLRLAAASAASTTPQNYLLRRAAITPHDIRIEAAIYAEQGSFFVIPGRWFNENPNDRRDTWAALGTTDAERNRNRLLQFGSYPETPFFGEPLNVRVTIVGAISQNMPPVITAQTESMRKWGWMPRFVGSTGRRIPSAHVPAGLNITGSDRFVPNLTLIHDPALATGRTSGFVNAPSSYIRFDRVTPDPGNPGFTVDYPLPPMPRLPVSPTLAYSGEVNP